MINSKQYFELNMCSRERRKEGIKGKRLKRSLGDSVLSVGKRDTGFKTVPMVWLKRALVLIKQR